MKRQEENESEGGDGLLKEEQEEYVDEHMNGSYEGGGGRGGGEEEEEEEEEMVASEFQNSRERTSSVVDHHNEHEQQQQQQQQQQQEDSLATEEVSFNNDNNNNGQSLGVDKRLSFARTFKVLEVLEKLDENVKYFSQPLDLSKSEFADYLEKIKTPLDFSTIKERVRLTLDHPEEEKFAYTDRDAMREIRICLENALAFHGKQSELGLHAKAMREAYDKEFYTHKHNRPRPPPSRAAHVSNNEEEFSKRITRGKARGGDPIPNKLVERLKSGDFEQHVSPELVPPSSSTSSRDSAKKKNVENYFMYLPKSDLPRSTVFPANRAPEPDATANLMKCLPPSSTPASLALDHPPLRYPGIATMLLTHEKPSKEPNAGFVEHKNRPSAEDDVSFFAPSCRDDFHLMVATYRQLFSNASKVSTILSHRENPPTEEAGLVARLSYTESEVDLVRTVATIRMLPQEYFLIFSSMATPEERDSYAKNQTMSVALCSVTLVMHYLGVKCLRTTQPTASKFVGIRIGSHRVCLLKGGVVVVKGIPDVHDSLPYADKTNRSLSRRSSTTTKSKPALSQMEANSSMEETTIVTTAIEE